MALSPVWSSLIDSTQITVHSDSLGCSTIHYILYVLHTPHKGLTIGYLLLQLIALPTLLRCVAA